MGQVSAKNATLLAEAMLPKTLDSFPDVKICNHNQDLSTLAPVTHCSVLITGRELCAYFFLI